MADGILDRSSGAARSGRSTAACLVTIAGYLAIAYWPELTFQKSFFYFDISSLNLPARDWGFRQIRAGWFPEWCRFWGTGFPFVAESQSGICYPPNYLVYPFLPSWKAYTVAYLAHLFLGGAGAFVLFRRWASPVGSLTGAILFCMGGQVLTHQIHTAIVEVYAWLPLTLHLLLGFLETGTTRLLSLATICAGMQMLAGAFPAVLCCHVAYATVFGTVTWMSPRFVARHAVAYGLFTIVATGIGAVLVLPVLQLLPHSTRTEGVAQHWSGWGAYFPYVWISSFVPFLFGHHGYGNAWLEGVTPWRELSFYHSAIALPLAAVAVTTRRHGGTLLLLVVAVVGLVLAAGPFHVAGELAMRLPVFSSLRMPARMLIVTGLALAGLVAIGWDACCDAGTRRASRFALLSTVAVLLGWMAVVGWIAYGQVLWPDESSSRIEALTEILQSDLATRLVDLFRTELPWWMGGLLVGLLCGTWSWKAPRLAGIVLIVCVMIDLGRFARNAYPTIEPAFHADPASARFVKGHVNPARVFVRDPPTNVVSPGYHYSMEPYRNIGECLYWERGPMFDVGVVSPSLGLPLAFARYAEFRAALESDPRYHQWLGIELLMSPKESTEPSARPVYAGDQCFIYPLPNPTGYAGYRPDAVWVEAGEALRQMMVKTTDPRQTVVIEQQGGARENSEASASAARQEPRPPDSVSVNWNGPNQFELALKATAAGYLVVRESWYPGWQATDAEGQKVEVLRGDHLFMAVAVKPGENRFNFEFRSGPIRLGAILSATCLALCVGSLAFDLRLRTTAFECGTRANDIVIGVTAASFVVSALVLWSTWRAQVYTLVDIW